MALEKELAAVRDKIAQQEQTAATKQTRAVRKVKEQAHAEQVRAEQAHAEISEKNTALEKELAAVRDKIAQQEKTATAEQAAAVRKAKEQARAEISKKNTALATALAAAQATIVQQKKTAIEQARAVREAEEQAAAARAEISEKNTALATALATAQATIAQQKKAATAKEATAARKAKELAAAAQAEISAANEVLQMLRSRLDDVTKDSHQFQLSAETAQDQLKNLLTEMAELRLNQRTPSASPRGDDSRTCQTRDDHGPNSQSPREYRAWASPHDREGVGRALPQTGPGCPLGAIVQLGQRIESGSPSCKRVARALLVKVLWLVFRTWAHSFRLLRFPEIATSDHATIQAIRQQLEVQMIFVAKWDQILSKK
jgi:hypothetical protein